MLAVLLAVTLQTFFQSLSASADPFFWQSAPFFFFALGALVFPLVLWGFRDWLLYFYVFGHEFTHVVFIYLCGGKVQGPIRVSLRGGHVLTNKTNLLIALSPYFIPFYAVIVMTSFAMAAFLVDLNADYTLVSGATELSYQIIYLLYAFIGFTMTMHVYFTASMIAKDQPDLQINGRLFSLLFILLINALIVVALVVAASSTMTFASFARLWLDNLDGWIRFGFLHLARLLA